HQGRGGSQPAISCKRQEHDRSSKTRGHGAARRREVNDCRNSRNRRKCDAACESTSASGCGTKEKWNGESDEDAKPVPVVQWVRQPLPYAGQQRLYSRVTEMARKEPACEGQSRRRDDSDREPVAPGGKAPSAEQEEREHEHTEIEDGAIELEDRALGAFRPRHRQPSPGRKEDE